MVASRKDLIKAYRYGRSLIPFHRIEEAEGALKTSKSIYVLGFLPASQVPREAFMSGVLAMVADGGEAEELALSAIIRGLFERDSVALVRYVRAEGVAPRLGILIPRIKRSYESLLFVLLPWAEDHRRYLFAPFDQKASVSEEQEAAMKAWIESMNLMTAEGEALRPGDTFNILSQHHYATVQQRVLKPSAPIVDVRRNLELIAHLSTPPEVSEASREAFLRLTRVFSLQRPVIPVETAPEKSTDEPINNGQPQIDPNNPLPGFKQMITDKHRDLVLPALQELMRLIRMKLVESDIDAAFEYYLELRQASINVGKK